MTIYLVVSGEYSEYGVDAVFLDEEKARLYCAARNAKETDDPYDACWIEEYDTHDSEDLLYAWEYLPQEDDDLAIKIAQDMAAEAKAKKEGLT